MIVTFWSDDDVVHTPVLVGTVSWLAQWGYATLCVDWDIVSGGLTRALRQAPAPGVSNFVDSHRRGRPIKPDRYVRRIELAAGGSVDLWPAGATRPAFGHATWQQVYAGDGLGETLEQCCEVWRERYDLVLINTPHHNDGSRGITLAHLPDVVVPVYTSASVDAMASTLRRVDQARDALPYGRSRLVVVPFGRGNPVDVTPAFEPWLRAWVSRDIALADVVAALRSPAVIPVLSVRRLAALLARDLAGSAKLADPAYVAVAATARASRVQVPRHRPRFYRRSKVPHDWLIDLAGAAVARTAPQELRMFNLMAPTFADDPIGAVTGRSTRGDSVLGFGVDLGATTVSQAAVYIALRLLEAAALRWPTDRPLSAAPRLPKDQFYTALDAGLNAAVSLGMGTEQAVAIVDAMLERLPVASPQRGEETPVAEDTQPERGQPDRGDDGD